MMDKHEITWQIKNLLSYPGSEIKSPVFSAGDPSHSVCYIKLFILVTNEGKVAVSHKLNFLKGSYLRAYTCKVSIVGDCGLTKQIPLFNPCKQNYQFVDEKFLGQDLLTLRCKLMFPVEHKEYTADVTGLSKKILSLYESQQFSDLVLRTSDKDFHVIKFLLEKRAPKSLEYLGVSSEAKSVLVDKISTPVLSALLHYVHSGKLGTFPIENLFELCELAKKWEIENFQNDISHKKLLNLFTNIKVIHQKISKKIEIANTIVKKDVLYELIHMDSENFVLTVSLGTTDQRISVSTSIACLSRLEEPIELRCITSSFVDYLMGMGENNLENHPEDKLRFTHDYESNKIDLPVRFLNKNVLENSHLLLVFDLSLCKCENTCYSEVMKLQCRSHASPELPSIFGMGILSSDLDELFHEMEDSIGDLKLCFKDGEISANLAILAASSPDFSEMFHHDVIEKRTRRVNISDIDLKTGKRLVRYMYSSKITRDCYENDKELYKAVDKYKLYQSLGKMTALMKSHLNEEINACDILVLAHEHKNESLFKTASLFISTNRSVILKYNSWISLCRNHPELVSKVLQDMSGGLRMAISGRW